MSSITSSEQKTIAKMQKEAAKAEKAAARIQKEAAKEAIKMQKEAAKAEKAATRIQKEAAKAEKAAEPKRQPKKSSASVSSSSVVGTLTAPTFIGTDAEAENSQLRIRLAAMEVAYVEAMRQLDAVRAVLQVGIV